MRELKVRLRDRSYSIVIGRGAVRLLAKELQALGLSGRLMVVTNRAVGELFLGTIRKVFKGPKFELHVHNRLPQNESAKSCKAFAAISSSMLRAGFDRSGTLVALGGGVVGDVAGFAASTYMRGIPWVVVPTTLLAQVDSSIGGKTGINLPEGKNLVGSFYQPRLVVSDIDFLKTLPAHELKHALAEVIKYAVIWDVNFFGYLEQNIAKACRGDLGVLERIVCECAAIKKTIVERDEREEKGLRLMLNYGHTFAHAFEAASSDWTRSLPHGKAVAVGMVAAGNLACRLGWFSGAAQTRQVRLIQKAGLPVTLGMNLSPRRILESMHHDKKMRQGSLRFVLPLKIGKVSVREDIPLGMVREIIEALRNG